VPFTFNSYVTGWIAALDSLRSLRARIIVPGHGPVMHDDSYVQLVARLLTSAKEQAVAAVGRGETLAQARKSIDLAEFRRRMAGDDKARQILFDNFVNGPLVGRAFAEASTKK